MMHLSIFMVLIMVFLTIIKGCGNTTSYEYHAPIDHGYEQLALYGHYDMCQEKPNDLFCQTGISIGDLQPTKVEVLYVLNEMNKNFTYKDDGETDTWGYNYSIHERLEDDCENITMTMLHQFYINGIDLKYLAIGFQFWSEDVLHSFAMVNTSDAGWLHVDYYGSGVPINTVDFHMLLMNAGWNKYIKGSINETEY